MLAGWPAFWMVVLTVVTLATAGWLLQAAAVAVLDIGAAVIRHGVELLEDQQTTATAPVSAAPSSAPMCLDTACTVLQLPGGDIVDLRAGVSTAAPAQAQDSGAASWLIGGGFAFAVAAFAALIVVWRRRRIDAWHDTRAGVSSIGMDGRFTEPEPAA